MTGHPHGSPAPRPADHAWVLGAWVLPLAIAIGFTLATAGIGALSIPIAVVIGLVATSLHRSNRRGA